MFKMYTQSASVGFPYEALVLDSLDALEVLAGFRDHRREVLELFQWLRGLACTSLVIGGLPSSPKGGAPPASERQDRIGGVSRPGSEAEGSLTGGAPCAVEG